MKKNLLKKAFIVFLSAVIATSQLPFANIVFAEDGYVETNADLIVVANDESIAEPAVDSAKSVVEPKEIQATFLPEEVYLSFNDEYKEIYADYCYEVEQYAAKGYDTSGFVAGTDSEGQLVIQFSVGTNELFTLGTPDVETIEDAAVEVEDVLLFDESDTPDNSEIIYANCNEELFEDLSEDLGDELSDDEDALEEVAEFSADPNYYGTLQVDNDWFVNQLSSVGKFMYTSTIYPKVVKAGNNTFKYHSDSFYAARNKEPAMYDALNAAVNTYPEKFDWVDRGTSRVTGRHVYRIGGPCNTSVKIGKGSFYNKNLEKEAQAKVEEIVAAARKYASANYPDAPAYGVVEYINKWICDHTYYEYIGTNILMAGTEKHYMCHVSYGALLKGYSVCESYALAAARLLDAAGIPNQYVMGEANGGGHAWNYVMMPDEQWYLLDTTWNDESSNNKEFFLTPLDGRTAHGALWTGGSNFKFRYKNVSPIIYTKTAEKKLEFPTQMYAVKGSKFELSMAAAGEFYGVTNPEWTIVDNKVAQISKKGIVTAKKAGTTPIIGIVGATTINSKITVVDKAKKMTHAVNDKPSIKYQVSPSSLITLKLNITPKEGTTVNAATLNENIDKFVEVVLPKKNSKVRVESVEVTGNQVTVTLKAISLGQSTVRVKCWGKTASAIIKVK